MLFLMHGMLLYLHKVCFKWNEFKDFSAWTQLTHIAIQTKVVGWNLHKTENSSFYTSRVMFDCHRILLGVQIFEYLQNDQVDFLKIKQNFRTRYGRDRKTA